MESTRQKVLPEVSLKDQEKILELSGSDRQKCEESLGVLKEWLANQPHLPKDMLSDDLKLVRRLAVCKNSIQRTKDNIDMYYTLRTAVPDILSNRDPQGAWFERAVKMGCSVPMPRLTESYERVVVMRYDSMSNPLEQMKILFMISDLRYNYEACVGDVIVVDCKDVSPSMVAKYTPPLLRKLQLIGFKAFNARIRGMHLVNLPQYIDLIIMSLKKVITKEKIRERIHTHCDLESLHQLVDKKYLPEEYGGTAGALHEHWENWKKFIMEHRDWFVEQDKYKVDESKRPGKALSSSELFGFEGLFRQLSVD